MTIEWLFQNPAAEPRRPYGEAQRAVLSLQRLAEVEAALLSCPAHRPTPLYSLPGLAAELGLGAVLYKDEGQRFGFGAFKALGGVYAVGRQLQRLAAAKKDVTVEFADLVAGRHADAVADIVVTAASSGNHGRAVAAGAKLFGCRCTIVLPAFTSAEKEAAIRARGADVLRIAGDYDQALVECRRLAEVNGWRLISDTSWDGYLDIPRDVVQAYAVIAKEVLRQVPATLGRDLPTHVLVQAGVGGLAAAFAATLWQSCGAARPQIVVVEPQSADCFMQTARAGRPMPASGDAASAMGGLACREISPDTWTILKYGADWFCTVPEAAVPVALRRLALPSGGDRPIAAGPSGSAGVQALLRLCADPAARNALGMDSHSVVLTIGSENAFGDAAFFADAVGCDPTEIEARGKVWDLAKTAAT